jgi:hypothetical protein
LKQRLLSESKGETNAVESCNVSFNAASHATPFAVEKVNENIAESRVNLNINNFM